MTQNEDRKSKGQGATPPPAAAADEADMGDEDIQREWQEAYEAAHADDTTPSGLHQQYAQDNDGSPQALEKFRLTGEIQVQDKKRPPIDESDDPTSQQFVNMTELRVLSRVSNVAAEVLANIEILKGRLPPGKQRESSINAQLRTAYFLLKPEVKALRDPSAIDEEGAWDIVTYFKERSEVFTILSQTWDEFTIQDKAWVCKEWAKAMGKPDVDQILMQMAQGQSFSQWLIDQILIGKLNEIHAFSFVEGAISLLSEMLSE